ITQVRRNTINHPLLRSVGIERADHMSARIVEHRGLLPELRVAGRRIIQARRKEWFVLLDDATLVVVNLGAADDNVERRAGRSQPSDRIARGYGLIRRQHASAEVRITEQDIFGLCSCLQQSSESIRILDAFYRPVAL